MRTTCEVSSRRNVSLGPREGGRAKVRLGAACVAICLLTPGGLFCRVHAAQKPGASALSLATEVGLHEEISVVCGSASVVILGERHRQRDGHALFLDMVEHFLARGERVVVGLEIGSDRQADLDAALEGARSCRGVASPPIESRSYEEMLRALGSLAKAKGPALRVLAIDTALGTRGDRDAEMAARISAALEGERYDRALVLVGNLHALKEIPWAREEPDQGAKLAGLLSRSGLRVVSFVQRFAGKCPGAVVARLERSGSAAATASLCDVWSCLRTDPSLEQAAAPAAADGVILWSCSD